MIKKDMNYRPKDIVQICKHMHEILENIAMSFSCIWLCLKLKFRGIGNVPVTEMLRILKESPRQSVHD